ncbi:hypothetical protein F441_09477 [Phytophthora nicotianae CJ01A1]|uniref:Uncharacterized protein n=3 Tax=Phytophthora nicotianae TaxID=4792 RepID=W2ZAB1_PHYNI|nr:hypothetical protein L915_09338 [Phytophthora nicotianae]ETL39410.1 hypothetical protein L916_09244 [Phytophthora nicotianae]ETP15853.1 hypothetical protein F441_09477 [Phytophthora nicotianae CJ01A1]ETP43906.1 hypothetical protein F442_09451 [Phytophthora nicotianae P10297]
MSTTAKRESAPPKVPSASGLPKGLSRQADGPNIHKRGLLSPPSTEVRKTHASHGGRQREWQMGQTD